MFLPASPFIPTSSFINFGDFCQPPRLLHPSRSLFGLKFASIPVYSALPFYLKLESKVISKLCIYVFFVLLSLLFLLQRLVISFSLKINLLNVEYATKDLPKEYMSYYRSSHRCCSVRKGVACNFIQK